MPTARDIMVRDVTRFRPSDTILRVVEVFVEKGISGAPVVDDEGRVVGVVSEFDVSRFGDKFLPLTIDLTINDRDFERILDSLIKMGERRVEDVMTKKVVTAPPDADIKVLAGKMKRKKINRIPIVDERGRLIGLVTRDNIIRSYVKKGES